MDNARGSEGVHVLAGITGGGAAHPFHSTTVGRYITVDRDVPVVCGGVRVHPGDLVVGDPDGVLVVPREAVVDVLAVAVEIEETERRMTEAIRRTGSIMKALDEFARIWRHKARDSRACQRYSRWASRWRSSRPLSGDASPR